MKDLFGNIDGLKKNQLKRLDNLYRHRIPPEYIASPELTFEIAEISREIGRQIGVLINRAGRIIWVIVGDHQKIVIPDTPEYRTQAGKLKGLRCIHTHLKNESLTQDDITDLALLRLDMLAAVTVNQNGEPEDIHLGHIRPEEEGDPVTILPPIKTDDLNYGYSQFIKELESEVTSQGFLIDTKKGRERAILVSVTTRSKQEAEDSLDELRELAETNDIHVIETVLQFRKREDPKLLIGKGKLSDIVILALQKAATMLIFDTELNPNQSRNITDHADMKVIDRTQLILDIFAQRARSREGKLQVELAQLKYMLPRLITKNTAMSRLTGGIGGRGPGETKLEINRRRARDRINQLGSSIKKIRKQRDQQKARRNKRGVPTFSIVGYTNAGKSTLLNTMTQSEIFAEDKLFATLDPSSRRLRFPRDMEVIITDTVGFIRDLPQELMESFRATLEELESADFLLHVIDISNPRFKEQISSVEKILEDLDLNRIPMIYIFNKMDLMDPDDINIVEKYEHSVLISAKNRPSVTGLIEKMEYMAGSLMKDTI